MMAIDLKLYAWKEHHKREGHIQADNSRFSSFGVISFGQNCYLL